MIDAAPPIWLPPKPAIIRPIEQKLLRPGFLPASRADRRAALKELVARKAITPEQAKRAIVFFVPVVGWGAGALPSLTFLNTVAATNDSSSYTFSSFSLGPDGTMRFIAVAMVARNATATDATASVAGTTINRAVQVLAATAAVAIYLGAVPIGTAGDIVISGVTSATNCGIGVWSIFDLLSATATDTASLTSADTAMAIDVEADGIVLGVSRRFNFDTCTWTNLTENYDVQFDATNNNSMSGASAQFASAQTVNITVDWAAGDATASAVASFR